MHYLIPRTYIRLWITRFKSRKRQRRFIAIWNELTSTCVIIERHFELERLGFEIFGFSEVGAMERVEWFHCFEAAYGFDKSACEVRIGLCLGHLNVPSRSIRGLWVMMVDDWIGGVRDGVMCCALFVNLEFQIITNHAAICAFPERF
jgi:hypothetical protein